MDERLGRGGMGEVWRGFDVELNRAVALKILLESTTSDAFLERFRREATIGAQFQHQGITVVHDIGLHGDRLFIVMELLQGEDLAQVLARSPSGLPIAEAVALATQAAQALAATHALGVVHRDLKPANLFRLADGRLKICDFGIARSVHASVPASTRTGWILGTPAYMAPEQWRGKGVDIRADLYALGCVLYELLTGAPPFAATDEPLAVMHRHFDEAPASLRSIRSDVPAELDVLIATLLAKEPDARPDARTTAARLGTIGSLLGRNPAGTQHEPQSRPAPAPTLEDDRETVTRHVPTTPEPVRRRPDTRRGPSRRGVILGGVATVALASGGTALGLHLTAERAWRLWFTLSDEDTVRSVAFSPDGKILASGSTDGNLRLWDLATRSAVGTLAGHTDVVSSVVFSPDGRVLASGGADETVRLWDLGTHADTVTLTGHDGSVEAVAFSPDGKSLASGAHDIRLWDLTTQAITATLTSTNAMPNSVAFNLDGKTLASGGNDGSARLWDVATRKSIAILKSVSMWVLSVAFGPNGTLASAGLVGDDGIARIQLWDPVTHTNTATLTCQLDLTAKNDAALVSSVNAVAFSPDGRTLAGACTDHTVRLWDVTGLADTATLTGHTGPVKSVAFSPDGKLLASGGNDGTVRVWKMT